MSWLRNDTYLYLKAQRFRVDMLHSMEQAYLPLTLIYTLYDDAQHPQAI